MNPATTGAHDFEPVRLQQALELKSTGSPQALEDLCHSVLKKNPINSMALATLCGLMCERNEYAAAVALTREHLLKAPDDAYAHMNLAHCLINVKHMSEAKKHAQRAVELIPHDPKAWVNLASACYHLEAYEEGIDACRKALQLDPQEPRALNNWATLLKGQGDISAAVNIYRRAKGLDPANPVCYTNLMLALVYDETVSPSDILEEARRFADQFEHPVRAHRWSHPHSPLPNRRLRIGFLSPDLSHHAAMYFAELVIVRLPREQFEIYCYHTQVYADQVTARIRAVVDKFVQVPDADPRLASEMIHRDRIDILVDLAGHTTRNGLRAMAYKPAPVQVTWLGYPGTTGLSTMDWRVTDHIADPPGTDNQYTEQLIRLPGCFAAYRPHIKSPLQRFDPRYEVQPPPLIRKGFVTFGSCNNIAKVSRVAIATWSEILHQVPDSRMLIEGKDLDAPVASARMKEAFARHGIEPERLVLLARDSRQQYLTYHEIDVCLDTFPLTGGTTTFDALWMGVPLVSRVGRSFRERLSSTILINGGFREDVCANQAQYIEHAVRLATNPGLLRERRARQRAQMQASVLMDEPQFIDRFAKAMRMIWQRWCQMQASSSEADKPS